MLSNAVELVAPASDRMHANAFSVAATVKISTFQKKGCKKKRLFKSVWSLGAPVKLESFQVCFYVLIHLQLSFVDYETLLDFSISMGRGEVGFLLVFYLCIFLSLIFRLSPPARSS